MPLAGVSQVMRPDTAPVKHAKADGLSPLPPARRRRRPDDHVLHADVSLTVVAIPLQHRALPIVRHRVLQLTPMSQVVTLPSATDERAIDLGAARLLLPGSRAL